MSDDRETFDQVLATIRELFPEVAKVQFGTRDQTNGYGFVILEMLKAADADGVEHGIVDDDPRWDALDRRVDDDLANLRWDGVVGEDKQGYAEHVFAAA